MNTRVVNNYKKEMYEDMCKESKKEVTEMELEKPQTVAQSYSVLEKSFWSCESVLIKTISNLKKCSYNL